MARTSRTRMVPYTYLHKTGGFNMTHMSNVNTSHMNAQHTCVRIHTYGITWDCQY
jgi:hypothetical protein